MEIPLIGESFPDRSLKAWPGYCRNLYPKAHPGKTSDYSLHYTPGWTSFGSVPVTGIRGIHSMNGTLYAVAGTALYSVNQSGTATSLGTVAGSTFPKMDTNGTQLIIPVGANVYEWDGSTFSSVTLPGAMTGGCSAVAFVGQYCVYMHDGSGECYVSDVGDATTIDSLQFFTSEQVPDNNVSIHQFQGNLWIFGLRSVEVWYVSNQFVPFNPYQNGVFNVGCGARLSVASNENYICWLSDNRRVYASAGGKPEPISSPDVEWELSKLSSVNDAEGYLYTEEGHQFYVLSFTNGNLTICYDFTARRWHVRSSKDADTGEENRQSISFMSEVYGKRIVADATSGNLYAMDLDYYTEAGNLIRREFIMPTVQQDGLSTTQSNLELLAQTGITPLNDTEANVELRWSDTGADWSNWVPRGLGAEGQRTRRLRWNGLGLFNERFYHVRTAVDAPVRFLKAFAEGSSGRR